MTNDTFEIQRFKAAEGTPMYISQVCHVNNFNAPLPICPIKIDKNNYKIVTKEN